MYSESFAASETPKSQNFKGGHSYQQSIDEDMEAPAKSVAYSHDFDDMSKSLAYSMDDFVVTRDEEEGDASRQMRRSHERSLRESKEKGVVVGGGGEVGDANKEEDIDDDILDALDF
jgi:hypothetical protein